MEEETSMSQIRLFTCKDEERIKTLEVIIEILTPALADHTEAMLTMTETMNKMTEFCNDLMTELDPFLPEVVNSLKAKYGIHDDNSEQEES
jgi:tetrahydromethanopterin S-methyltransferase subunit B